VIVQLSPRTAMNTLKPSTEVFFFFLLTLVWFYAPSALKAQVFTEEKERSSITGVFRVWETQKVFFEESKRLRAEVRLPAGQWTLRFVTDTKSTHKNPVIGKAFWLDQVRKDGIHQLLRIVVFEANRNTWSDSCERGLDQKMLVGMFSDCYSMRLEGFMNNPKSSIQSEVRKRWVDGNLVWPSMAVITIDQALKWAVLRIWLKDAENRPVPVRAMRIAWS